MFRILLALIIVTQLSIAGTSVVKEEKKKCSFCDTFTSPIILYEGKEDSIINQVKIGGRFHYQYAILDYDKGNNQENEIRRTFDQINIRFLDNLNLLGIVIYDLNDMDPIYSSILTLKVYYKNKEKDLKVGFGKGIVPFNYERTMSSKYIKQVEFSVPTNQVRPAAKVGGFYEQGFGASKVFLGLYGGNKHPEFDQFGESYFGLVSYSYDLAHFLEEYDNFRFRLAYLYNDSVDNNTTVLKYQHGIAFTNYIKKNGFSMASEFIATDGFGNSSFGVNIIPTYYVYKDKLEVVGRFSYMSSDVSSKIKPNSKYEKTISSVKGDEFWSAYAGLNWYICKDKFKFMLGAEYSEMKDSKNSKANLEGTTVFLAFRYFL